MKRAFLWLLAGAGAVDCLFVPVLFIANLQQPLFPQPGIYFLEIALLGIVGGGSVFRANWQFFPWLAVGILLVFNILGAWTIGLWLIPATLCFLGTGIWLANGQRRALMQGLAWCFFGVLGHVTLMLTWIYFS